MGSSQSATGCDEPMMMFQSLKASDGEGKRVGRGKVPKKAILSEFQLGC